MSKDVSIKVANYDGKPGVRVIPKTVPKGNMGGAGVFIPAESKEQAKQIAKALKAEYAKAVKEKYNPANDQFVKTQKAAA